MKKTEKSRELAILVGQNIAQRRKMRGLTQEVLAQMLSIGQQSLSRIEKGKVAPLFERLTDFAKVFDCTVSDLFRVPGAEEDPYLANVTDILSPLSPEAKQTAVNMLAPIARELLQFEKTAAVKPASRRKSIPK